MGSAGCERLGRGTEAGVVKVTSESEDMGSLTMERSLADTEH